MNSKHDEGVRPFGLTNREFDVLTLVCNGNSNGSIAKTLNLTPRSVHVYSDIIYGKLGISGNPDYSQRVKTALMYRGLYPYEFFRDHLDVDPITPREFNVLGSLAQGYSNLKTASRLGIRFNVNRIVVEIYQKLRLSSKDPDTDVRVLAMLMSDRITPTDRRGGLAYRNRV